MTEKPKAKLKLQYSSGRVETINFWEDLEKVTLFRRKTAGPSRKSGVLLDRTFEGIWLTNQDYFVEVIHAKLCYILQEDGRRLFEAAISDSGIVSVDGGPICSVLVKRRGEETSLTYAGRVYQIPTLGKSRRGQP